MNNDFTVSSQLGQVNHFAQAQTYTDLAGLEKIKQQAQTDGDGALREVARQFESVFLNIVLKSMRNANQAFAEDGLFNSQQSQMYRDMYDQQISLSMTEGSGLGLADMLVKQLGRFVERAAPAETAERLNQEQAALSAPQLRGLQAYQDVSNSAGN